MSSVVAIVKSIVGQVFVISPEGTRRVLVEGDRLFAGDQIDTGMSGAVSLELADGRILDLGRDTQWSADMPDSTADLAAASEQAAPSVAELQQAIAAGADPTTELEATAAGANATGNGAAGGGHSFVVLDATAGRVDPTIGFPTAPIGQGTSALNALSGAPGSADSGNQVLQPSTLTLSATPTITEAGGVLTYTATVTRPSTSDLTVTLTNGAVITIPSGQLTGTVNVPLAPNDSPYIDPGQISVGVTGTTGGGNLVLTIDPNPAVTQITDTIDTTTVTLTAGNTVTEGGQITYTATLTNPAQTPVNVTLSNGSVITIKAGESTGTVVVDTPANDVYNNGSTVSTTITGATGGNFENLVPSTTPAVTTITDSVDTTTVTLTANSNVTEGGQITYTATLTNPAQTPVNVTLSN
ncbi:retention module-containing protein, partial [Pseudomonas synxantha]|uniref:retention module-containing protein n=2 Tax=Pseudomonas TaxID=286 RepID=UPI00099BDF8C